MTESSESPPPTEVMAAMEELRESRWPKVIGVISLIYAICGLLCATFLGLWIPLHTMVPEMFRGGVTLPPVLRLSQGFLVICAFTLGILMIVGASNLLRRRRHGVRQLRTWAIARLGLVFVGLVIAIATSTAQVQMARMSDEFVREMSAKGDRPIDTPVPTDAELWQKTLIQSLIGTAVLSVYPIFIALYLSRGRIEREIEVWD